MGKRILVTAEDSQYTGHHSNGECRIHRQNQSDGASAVGQYWTGIPRSAGHQPGFSRHLDIHPSENAVASSTWIAHLLFAHPQIHTFQQAKGAPPRVDQSALVQRLHVRTMGFGKGKSNPIVDYIINSKADIVCLQESDAREAGEELIEKRLKDAYPHHDFVKITDSGGQHMMLLTKFPIIRKERIEYKSAGNISYAYIIDYKGTEVLVVNNHFESNHLSEEDKQSYKNIVKSPLETKDTERASFRLLTKLGEAAAIRSPQVEKVAAYVKTYMDRHVPVILCGDFNDSPISFAHHTLEKQLTDCYIASGNGPGISYHKNGMYFRIDHIFCSDDFEPFEAKVDDKIDNSDHYPIYTWLKYRPKP